MKQLITILTATAVAISTLFVLPAQAALVDDLSGRILLQVEKNGEAWYVDPETKQLSFLGRPLDAFNLMREFGLGISNENLDKLQGDGEHTGPADLNLSKQLSGKILLQVEDAGQAWYINPVDLNRYYLGTPKDAFNILREKGLGISEASFAQLPINAKYTDSVTALTLAQTAFTDRVGMIEDQPTKPRLISKLSNQVEMITDGSDLVVKVTLNSPLSTDQYGYLGKGDHYYIPKTRGVEGGLIQTEWEKYGGLFPHSIYVGSAPQNRLFGEEISAQITEELAKLQLALEAYKTEIGGYPLSSEGGDRIGGPGRNLLTNPNGFYGTKADLNVYQELQLPFAGTFPYIYLYQDIDDGNSYKLTYSILVLNETTGDLARQERILTPAS